MNVVRFITLKRGRTHHGSSSPRPELFSFSFSHQKRKNVTARGVTFSGYESVLVRQQMGC